MRHTLEREVSEEHFSLPSAQQAELVLLEKQLASSANLQESKYTLSSLVEELLPKLEAARKWSLVMNAHLATAHTQGNEPADHSAVVDYGAIVSRFLTSLQQEYSRIGLVREDGVEIKAGNVQADLYWEGIQNVLTGDFVQAYSAIAARHMKTEQSTGYNYGYGNRVTLTALSALPGLATLRMPLSTPIVMAGLGFAGYKFLYPFLQRTINSDIHHLAQFTRYQQQRLEKMALGTPISLENFSVRNILDDLIPQLEVARMAGKDYQHFEQCVAGHMNTLHEAIEKQKLVLPMGKWTRLASLIYDEFLPRFGTYAQGQNKKERRGLLYRVFTNKWASAAISTAVLVPLYSLMSRNLPLGVVDDLMMAGLCATGGYHLPKMINPMREDLPAIYNHLCQRDIRESLVK